MGLSGRSGAGCGASGAAVAPSSSTVGAGRSRRLRVLRRHRLLKCRVARARVVGAAAGAGARSTAPSSPPLGGTSGGAAAGVAGGAGGGSVVLGVPVEVELPGAARGLPETSLRNIALEAVRVGNYWAEPEAQADVLSYIRDQFVSLLNDAKWMKKYAAKMASENAFTERYTVGEILAKKHEVDGYDVFVQPHEALAKKAAEDAAAEQKGSRKEVDPAVYGELQEGLDEVVASFACESDPVGADEVLDLLEGCASAGEMAAAVYCGERLEALHGEAGLPEEALNRSFEALKPLLRPSAAAPAPKLTGPWQQAASRKSFGRLLDRLGRLRKERELARGGEAAEQADRSAKGEAVLGEVAEALLPWLLEDGQVVACKRRGPLVVEIGRVCRAQGLEASTAVVWDIIRILEERGVLGVDGRDVVLRKDAVAGKERTSLKAFAGQLAFLDGLARQRLEKRARRRKAREQSKASKRQRLGAGG